MAEFIEGLREQARRSRFMMTRYRSGLVTGYRLQDGSFVDTSAEYAEGWQSTLTTSEQLIEALLPLV